MHVCGDLPVLGWGGGGGTVCGSCVRTVLEENKWYELALVLAVLPAGYGQGAGSQLAGESPLSAPWPTSTELKGAPMLRQPGRRIGRGGPGLRPFCQQ